MRAYPELRLLRREGLLAYGCAGSMFVGCQSGMARYVVCSQALADIYGIGGTALADRENERWQIQTPSQSSLVGNTGFAGSFSSLFQPGPEHVLVFVNADETADVSWSNDSFWKMFESICWVPGYIRICSLLGALLFCFVSVQNCRLAYLKNNTDLCSRKPKSKVYGKRQRQII